VRFSASITAGVKRRNASHFGASSRKNGISSRARFTASSWLTPEKSVVGLVI
jgi:hypothetical protein